MKDVKAVSFDCYGTLVDWQTGILAALTPVASPAMTPQQLLLGYAQAERAAEAGPYRSYRQVLRDVARALLGASTPHVDVLWKSLPDWPVFPDTPSSLRRLQRSFKVAIVSNVDRDLFAGTVKHLGITPDVAILAGDVRSYKPARAHFDALVAALHVTPGAVVHAGESRFHDVEPANALGFKTVWVRRVAQGHSASGDDAAQPLLVVDSLEQLASELGC